MTRIREEEEESSEIQLVEQCECNEHILVRFIQKINASGDKFEESQRHIF